MNDLSIIISYELVRLIDDYYKCEDSSIRKQIQIDIQLLSDALVIDDSLS